MRAGRGFPFLLLAGWVLVLNACSFRLTAPGEFPEAAVLHDVTPYRQEPRFCGPYSLAAVLDYLGIKADPVEIAEEIYSPGAGGTLTMDLYLEARRRGARPSQVRGTPETLREKLKEGAPVIVLLKYPGLGKSTGHFVVVEGYSNVPSGFFLLWGDGKVSWMGKGRLMDFWSGSDFWALVFPKGGSVDP